jgi:hypothetical protein
MHGYIHIRLLLYLGYCSFRVTKETNCEDVRLMVLAQYHVQRRGLTVGVLQTPGSIIKELELSNKTRTWIDKIRVNYVFTNLRLKICVTMPK